MKKIFLIAFLLSTGVFIRAEEGMWIPLLLKQLNETDMKAKGLKLNAEDIYSVNSSSLKDAVVQFGGGCTGELISPEGLILTNHHCGFGMLQNHSSVQNDYITHGYWAKNRSEELPNKSLSVTFIIRIEDVTSAIKEGLAETMTENQKDSMMKINYSRITGEAVKGTHYDAFIRPFYYGNEYYLFVTEVFRDVRLVGSPPSSIGKFGGDTDNWAWPRHTGDFMLFRIYADKNNKPAAYSPDNVPYKPRHFLPVSMKGIEEDDFTMVYGFPGRTNEYLSSYGVDMIMNISDPARILLRDTALQILRRNMLSSDEVRIKYAAKHDRISNYHKKWIGEVNGLKKFNTIQRKKDQEKLFMERVMKMPDAPAAWKSLYAEMQIAYDKARPYQLAADYYSEVTGTVEIIRMAAALEKLIRLSTESPVKEEYIAAEVRNLTDRAEGIYKNYDASTDQKLCAALLSLYARAFTGEELPDIFKTIRTKYKNDFGAYSRMIFEKSVFASADRLKKALSSYKSSSSKKITEDPAYVLMKSINEHYTGKIQPDFAALSERIASLNETYMTAQRKVFTEKKFYPDANSTLRITYGKIAGYELKDAVLYNWYTTLEGVIEKEDPSNPEFKVPEKLKELYLKKDYGRYADKNGKMRVAFIASNHTTGGNSGSPVLDANGNLIGLNFDRNWEGCMSDISYNPDQVRNISVDIRYVLFIVDKFAGAGYLVNEMKLVN